MVYQTIDTIPMLTKLLCAVMLKVIEIYSHFANFKIPGLEFTDFLIVLSCCNIVLSMKQISICLIAEISYLQGTIDIIFDYLQLLTSFNISYFILIIVYSNVIQTRTSKFHDKSDWNGILDHLYHPYVDKAIIYRNVDNRRNLS